MIRKAQQKDIPAVAAVFEAVHDAEEAGRTSIGWLRGVYPTRATAEAAMARDDLFVLEESGRVLGAGVINQRQVDVYVGAPWQYPASDREVMVLHTLVIDPAAARRGYGSAFVAYYEKYALAHACPYLRMDTNARNAAARRLYKKLGYREIATVPCVFNGIPDVELVLLEKRLDPLADAI